MSKILENRDYFLKENITGKENYSCKFRYYSDDENLYFQFIVEDEDIISLEVLSNDWTKKNGEKYENFKKLSG